MARQDRVGLGDPVVGDHREQVVRQVERLAVGEDAGLQQGMDPEDPRVSALTANLTTIGLTGLVGRFGVAALAGYGIGVRLEFMLVPLAYGIGSGLTTLVGVAAGARDWKRAVRVAWIGGLAAFGLVGAFGWIVALVPEEWSRLFTSDPQVIAATVGLHHPCRAVLLPVRTRHDARRFASQGAGRMQALFYAGIFRMIVATAGGWFAIERLGTRPRRRVRRDRRRHHPVTAPMIARPAAGETLGAQTC